jgi:hypothetical protein
MFDAAFWRSVGIRSMRQAAQVALPFLAALAATGQATNASITATLIAASTAVVVTVLSSMAGVTVTPQASWWVRAAERAGKAAAGSLLGFVTAGTLLNVPWTTAVLASIGAAAAAVIQAWLSPPAADAVEHRRAARHLKTEGGRN